MKQKKNPEKNIILIREIIISFLAIAFMTFVTGTLTYILNRPVSEIIRTTITFLWGSLTVLFLWYQSKIHQNLEYDNAHHPLRFLVAFSICFAVSIAMIFAPTSSWVFLSIMVVLSMFSNTIVGFTAGSVLLVITSSLSVSANMYVFYLYFMIGLIGVSLFRNLDLDFRVAGPLILSGMASLILQSAYIVIFENQPFSMNIMFMPILNLFINMVLLFLILKFFSKLSMYLLQDKYSDINDQEFPIMAELKKNNKESYFEAIHTAYLGERIARKLNINDKAVKGCCYYYKLAGNIVESSDGTMVPISEYYDFPEDLKALIKECDRGIYGSKESCVVLTSNKIIRSILMAGKRETTIPYEDIIDAVFVQMIHNNLLEACDISIRELKIMKNTYIEEKLYYDFLR